MRSTSAQRSLRLRAALVVVLGAAAAAGEAPYVGEMATVRNDVVGVVPGGAAARLEAGDGLVTGHRIETRADSAARMTLGTAGTLALGAETRIVLDELVLDQARREPSRLSLLVGSLRLRLGEVFRGELAIDTPSATIGIKGTDVQVDVYDGVTVVTVFSGTVSVVGTVSGREVEVTAGQRTVVRGSLPPTPPEPVDLFATAGPAVAAEEAAASAAAAAAAAAGATGAGAAPTGAGKPDSAPEPEPDDAPAAARLSGCTPTAQAGTTACACGSFPGREAAEGLTLDGLPVRPFSTTSDRVDFQLPGDLAAGAHLLGGTRAAGYPPGESCPITVLAVTLTFDPPLTRVGKKSKLNIEVLGTTAPVTLEIENRSPGVIELEGGRVQTVTTRGGAGNGVRLKVKTIGAGRAPVRVSVLGLPPCPCAAG